MAGLRLLTTAMGLDRTQVFSPAPSCRGSTQRCQPGLGGSLPPPSEQAVPEPSAGTTEWGPPPRPCSAAGKWGAEPHPDLVPSNGQSKMWETCCPGSEAQQKATAPPRSSEVALASCPWCRKTCGSPTCTRLCTGPTLSAPEQGAPAQRLHRTQTSRREAQSVQDHKPLLMPRARSHSDGEKAVIRGYSA